MSTPEEIIAAADALSLDDKLLVVSKLWASLPAKERWLPDDSDLEILNQRMAELESGQVEAIPVSEVRRRMHERLGNHG